MRTLRFSTLITCLALSTIFNLRAQDTRTAISSHHSVWRVEGKSNVVYLVGSIHVLKASDYPLPGPIEAAFTNARIAVFEADLDKMESPEAQQMLLSKSRLPEGETLQQELTPATYEQFTNHLVQAGVPAQAFDSLQPVMAVVSLESLELLKLGADPEHGLDEYFSHRAHAEGKEIMPLETMEFQIGLLTDFSKEENEAMVSSTLKEIDDTKKLYGEMAAAWRTGDAAALDKLMNDATKDFPALSKRLITDRNQRWVPKIEELLRGEKPAVVIVGAGHLVGSSGVVELLKKKGLKVTQL